MNQTQYTDARLGVSQCDLILRELKATPGQWVAMPRLVEVSGGYAVHSRAADLRKRGHTIEWRGKRMGNAVFSFYRITNA